MSDFYKKYFLENKDNRNGGSGGGGGNKQSSTTNILKKDFTLNYSDYEKLKIAEQYNKLYSDIYEQNKSDVTSNENKKIYNLSLSELVNNSGKVYINLLNDIAIFFSTENKDKTINKLGLVLTKEQNLLYIGLLILILAFFLWIIQVTS